MNINKLSINTNEAINARKVSLGALEDALKKKILELREICLKEGELTGQLPVEYPLQPREPLPQIRRAIELDLSKEPPRSNSVAKQASAIIPNKVLLSSSISQKHSNRHAYKLKDCTSSTLAETNNAKIEDMHQQILQIQKLSYDPSKAADITNSSARSDGNFDGIGSSSHEGLKYYGNKLESIHNRNHSESSIDQAEKLKYRQKQASISRKNKEFSGTARNVHYPRSDISSISIRTMIQPSSNTQDFCSGKYEAGQSNINSNQTSQQSIRLAHLHKEILKLQASQMSHASTDKNALQVGRLSNNEKLGSLDDALDRLSEVKHQRVVSDGCSHTNRSSQNRSGMQSNDFSMSKSDAHRSSDRCFNITEIPAESNRGSSPTISSTGSIGDENFNPLTSKISQLSINGVGNFQPYWEETKPYELSDFYKYSAKHRTGGRVKNNIKERIENLEQTIAGHSSQDLKANNNNDNNRRIQNFNTKLPGTSLSASSMHEQQSTSSSRPSTKLRYA